MSCAYFKKALTNGWNLWLLVAERHKFSPNSRHFASSLSEFALCLDDHNSGYRTD